MGMGARNRRLGRIHLNGRSAVAIISDWSWDRGEDDDNPHVAVVRGWTEISVRDTPLIKCSPAIYPGS